MALPEYSREQILKNMKNEHLYDNVRRVRDTLETMTYVQAAVK